MFDSVSDYVINGVIMVSLLLTSNILHNAFLVFLLFPVNLQMSTGYWLFLEVDILKK